MKYATPASLAPGPSSSAGIRRAAAASTNATSGGVRNMYARGGAALVWADAAGTPRGGGWGRGPSARAPGGRAPGPPPIPDFRKRGPPEGRALGDLLRGPKDRSNPPSGGRGR